VDEWLRLFGSSNPAIRLRAAQGLLRQGAAIPLPVLLEILDELHDYGLGADVERVLLTRRDPELAAEMIDRLKSAPQFVRAAACGILGRLGDRIATPHLLAALGDPDPIVRRAAGFGLAVLAEPVCGPAVLRHYEERVEDSNVRWALIAAMKAVGVAFDLRRWRQ
jgi:HEAT repeat protein